MWYDLITTKNSLYTLKNQKKKLNSKIKKQNFIYPVKYKESSYLFSIPIPYNFKTIIIKNVNINITYLYLWSKTYFFKIPINNKFIRPYFSTNTYSILLKTDYISPYTKTYITKINTAVQTLISPFFTKIQFKGKGYYLYKSYRHTITPQFGYSHRLYLYTFFLFIKFLNKTSLIIFGLNRYAISKLTKSLFLWRPVNIFTGRGVRFTKQIIYKKSGKISSYR